MKLHELSPAPGSVKKAFRKGRGSGSGNGKTAGKGHKGQNAINVSDLNVFEDGAVVDEAAIVAAGLVKKTLDGIKILGNGELQKKLTVNAKAFSASAKQKIEAAGGKAEVM